MQTHPWLSFSADMRAAPPALWLALGEARSKCQHLAGVPLKPEVADLLHQVFLAKGALATTAIEGNTLSEKEALDIVQKKSDLPHSQANLKKELQNIVDASNKILTEIERDGVVPITVEDIKAYNKAVLSGLIVSPHVVPGECVKTDVVVAGYHGAPWRECELLLQKLCDWLNSKEFVEPDGDGIATGILKAIISHIYLVWIHPFGDGNGRTARLLEVRFLIEAGVPSAAGHLLSNFYNRTRNDYYRQLSDASKNGGNLIGFILYAATGFVEELREQLKMVKKQQWSVSWENYIFEVYEGHHSVSDKRQRSLVLALSKFKLPVAKGNLRRITPEIAEAYASKTDKTLSRDLNALEQKGLIVKSKDGYRAAMETIIAFLPTAKKGSRAAQIKEAALFTEEDDGQIALDLK